MLKMATILEEVSALEGSLEKLASSEPTKNEALASFLDKMAEKANFMEEDDKEKKDKEEDKKDGECTKESSMQLDDNAVEKIAAAVLAKLEKIAVLDTNETQGSEVTNTAGGSNDGAATNASRATDQIIPGAKVQSSAEGNPQAHNPKSNNGNGDLIVNQAPNMPGMAEPLQKAGSVTFTAKEAEILQKFASIGYEHVVDVQSDAIVREKIASAVAAERAKNAPTKIAQAIIANEQAAPTEKTARDNQVAKLAQIKKNDPTLFSALKVLADRKLI